MRFGGWRFSCGRRADHLNTPMRTVIPPNSKLVPPEAQRVFKGIIFDTYQWQQEMFDGTTETFEMLKRPDSIKILAVKDGKIVILDQEQPNHEFFYDVPGGRHDIESETELEAAKREMLEETGMTFRGWRLLEVFQPYYKIECFVYIFLATDFITQTDQNLDSGEKISIELIDFDRLKTLIHDPKAHYLPKELLDKAQTLNDLLNLPEYK